MSNYLNLSDRKLRDQVIEMVQPISLKISNKEAITDIAKDVGLRVKEGKLPLDKDGAYIDDKKTIILNSSVKSEERKLFSFYHELVHYFLRGDDDLYSYLHETYVNSRDFDRTVELLCNIGAAEFILPRDKVRNLIEDNEFSIMLVEKICDQGCVSGPAALIQLIQCAPHNCYGVVCEFGVSPYSISQNQDSFIEQQKNNSLFVLYSIWSPSARYSIARFTIIPKDHLLTQSMIERKFVKGKDSIPFRSGTEWQAYSEAIFFRGKVYGLFNVSSPPNQRQLKLL